MDLSKTIATVAIVLGVVLAAGYASSQDNTQMPMPKQTAQEKIVEREAQRREAMKLHQERKTDFARRCNKPALSNSELDYCRVAYRKL